MKALYLPMIFILMSSCVSESSEEAGETKDFSKDEIVLSEVNRITKNRMSLDDVCIERPTKFKDLVLVGFFAHDRGCDGGLMFYKGREVDRDNDIPKILRDNGWNDRTRREVIALDWVKSVSLVWEHPLEYDDDDFKKQEEHIFMPPTVTDTDGEITVAIWVKEPSGMSPEANFYLLTVVFSKSEADIIRSQITDRFSVEF